MLSIPHELRLLRDRSLSQIWRHNRQLADLFPLHATTQAVGIVVSESSVVRLFCHGQLVGEIIPEVWMMDHAAHLRGSVKREQVRELTIMAPNMRQTSIAK